MSIPLKKISKKREGHVSIINLKTECWSQVDGFGLLFSFQHRENERKRDMKTIIPWIF